MKLRELTVKEKLFAGELRIAIEIEKIRQQYELEKGTPN